MLREKQTSERALSPGSHTHLPVLPVRGRSHSWVDLRVLRLCQALVCHVARRVLELVAVIYNEKLPDIFV